MSLVAHAASDRPHGPFSIKRYPVTFPIKFGQCFLSLDGHGGRREGGPTDTRSVEAKIKKTFDTSVLSTTASAISAEVLEKTHMPGQVILPVVGQDMNMSNAGGVEFSVARVMGKTWSPGLSFRAHDSAPASNFTLRLPMVAQYMSSRWNSSRVDNNLLDMERELLTKVKTLDIACKIVYPKEPSSNPRLTSENEFYHVDVVTRDNFPDAFGRVIHPVPNPSENVDEETGRPKRFETYGAVPFKYYGLFVVAVSGGGLPQECTLSANHGVLRRNDYSLDGVIYPMYHEDEYLQSFNLIAWENREDVETRIGVCNRFLDNTGQIIGGMEEAWEVFKHDMNGPIQILRRAIYVQEITHIETAILLRSLGYIHQGLMDSACNCPEDMPDDPEMYDSAQHSFSAPMTHEEIRVYKDADFEFFQDLYAQRQNMRRIARNAAAAAAAAAEAAAEAAAAEAAAEAVKTQVRRGLSNIDQVRDLIQRTQPAVEEASLLKDKAEAAVAAAEAALASKQAIAGDPKIQRSISQAKKSTDGASNSIVMARLSCDYLQSRLAALEAEAQRAETEQGAREAWSLATPQRAQEALSLATPQRAHETWPPAPLPPIPLQIAAAQGEENVMQQKMPVTAAGAAGSSNPDQGVANTWPVGRTLSAGFPSSFHFHQGDKANMQEEMPVMVGLDGDRERADTGAVIRARSAPSSLETDKRPKKTGGTRKLRKRTTVRRKKIMRKTKKRTYRKKSQKRNNRK
jgi:hypothetical protein